ncbi:hypothetical protein LLG95_05390 [bacterium]|nr:hypothetical protein [bacterium]
MMPCDQQDRLERIEDDVTRVGHAVYGNGDPGIRTNLAIMAQQQKDHREQVDIRLTKIETNLSRLLWLVLASIVSALMQTILK